MRTIHNLQQGSPEWHEHRKTHDNASDASAMMGVSPHRSRSEFVRDTALGVEREVTPQEEARFANGHRFEEMARPWAEEIVGEDLFPAVVSLPVDGLRLSASCDGIVMSDEVLWEHKTLNQDLDVALAEGVIPECYHPQIEQQLLVTGAAKCLFMASAGSREGMRFAWYESNPVLRAQIIAGWKQFHEDVLQYVHVEPAAKAVAAHMVELPSILIDVQGVVDVVNNLPAFRARLADWLRDLPVKPETDDEFATCEAAVKKLKAAEERLEMQIDAALAKLASIEQLRSEGAALMTIMRDQRLATDKRVKDRKESIRDEIRRGGAEAFAAHMARLDERLGGRYMPTIAANFAEVMKGKKTVASLRDAVNTELARLKIASNDTADRIERNLRVLRDEGCMPYIALFPDAPTICLKAADDFLLLVQARIEKHKAAQQAALDQEREKIRREEEAKAQAAVAVKAEPPLVEQPKPASVPVPAHVPAPATIQPPRFQGESRPSDAQIVAALAAYFKADECDVIDWLFAMDLKAAMAQLPRATVAG